MVDPDLDLVEATGRGDQEAFESLVKRYQGPLLNFITRFGVQYHAEDITQEVFLRIYRAAPRFQARAKVSTWIFQIAYNQALTEIGRHNRQRNLNEALYQNREGSRQENLTGPAEPHLLEEEILSALGRLPDNQRAALLLRSNEGLSYREIGAVLEVSIQSVESLLFRARTNLKRYLGKK
ncbi:MAG: sigma-70 family RNA polymerase sigma factor [Thermodesulfobacteriota bacterium]